MLRIALVIACFATGCIKTGEVQQYYKKSSISVQAQYCPLDQQEFSLYSDIPVPCGFKFSPSENPFPHTMIMLIELKLRYTHVAKKKLDVWKQRRLITDESTLNLTLGFLSTGNNADIIDVAIQSTMR